MSILLKFVNNIKGYCIFVFDLKYFTDKYIENVMMNLYLSFIGVIFYWLNLFGYIWMFFYV